MKEPIFLAGNVTKKFLRREDFLNTEQYMKASNSFVGNITIKPLERDTLLNTKVTQEAEKLSAKQKNAAKAG